jgi:hypothetical protein
MRAIVAILGSVVLAHLMGTLAFALPREGFSSLVAAPIIVVFTLPYLAITLPAALIHYALLSFLIDLRLRQGLGLGIGVAAIMVLLGAAMGALFLAGATGAFGEDRLAPAALLTGGFAGMFASGWQIWVATGRDAPGESANQSSQPMPGGHLGSNRAPPTRHGWPHRSAK